MPETTSPTPTPPRHSPWPVLLVLSATFATFAIAATHRFVYWDDNSFLVENPDFNPPTAAALPKFWGDPLHGYIGFYIPVTYTVDWLAAHVARRPVPGRDATLLNPAVFHTLSLLFHTAAAAVMFLVLRRLTKSDWPAAAGALLFALHPTQVEPVAWASSLYTPLSGLFAISALLAYLAATDARDAGQSRRARALSAAGLLCFAVALLTKPTIILLPAIIAAIEVGLRNRRPRAVIWSLLPWFVLAAADALLTSQTRFAADAFVPHWWERPLVAADSIAFYLRSLVFPFHLVPDYSRTPQWVLEHEPAAYAWILPATVALACWRFRRTFPFLWVGFAIFALAILPMSGLTPFEFQFYSTVADRYAYFALLGPALVLAFALQQTADRAVEAHWPRLAVPAATAALCATLAVSAHLQTRHWRDTKSLFTHTLGVNPRSLIAHRQMGLFLVATGRTSADTEAALAHYRAALEIYPADAEIMSNIGAVLLRLGRPAEAVKYLQQAAALRPNAVTIHYNLALALSAANRPTEAAEQFRQVLRLSPDFADANGRLAQISPAD